MIRDVPDDVWGSLAVLVVLAAAVTLEPGAPVRVFVTLCVLLFLPGYALLTLLFPRRPDDVGRSLLPPRVPETLTEYLTGRSDTENPSLGVRLALSVGASVALLPLLGLLTAAVTDVSLASATAVCSGFVLVALGAGTVRRLRTPADERYAPSFVDGAVTLRARLLGETRGETALNVVLGISVLVAVASAGFVFTVPNDGTTYTTAALYAENDEGELVAGSFPTEMTAGETAELVLAVENHHGRSVDYTVVAMLQKTDREGSVVAERRFATFERTVGADATWRQPHRVTPSLVGERVRVTYLVYESDPPDSPSRTNADVAIYHWVSVTER
jgi:uncharacterized membrane protein